MSKVQWEISNDEVTDRDTALRRLQEGTTGHVVCARDGACLQSYKEADGVYHCEIVFKTDSCCPPVFAAPEGVTGKGAGKCFTIVLPMGTIFPLWKRNGNL